MSRAEIGNLLLLQIHTHHSFWVCGNRARQLVAESGAHRNRQHKAVEQVAAVYIGKTVRYHHPYAVTRNRPCGMLAAGAGAPVGAGNHYLVAALMRTLAVSGVVKHKILNRPAVGTVTQVVHERIAEITQVTGGSCHIPGRNYQVGITVVYIYGNAG